MKTRLREIRLSRQLTLQELATKLGTSPQTVQRLETGRMTVSLAWLERFGKALGIPVGHLLQAEASPPLDYLGELDAHGRIKRTRAKPAPPLLPPMTLNDPVMVRLRDPSFGFFQGTYLIADKEPARDEAGLSGTFCIAKLKKPFTQRVKQQSRDYLVIFGRMIEAPSGHALLIAGDNGPVFDADRLAWQAPLLLVIQSY